MVANPIPPTLFYSAYPRVCISIAGQELFKNQIIVLYNLCEKREKKFGLPTYPIFSLQKKWKHALFSWPKLINTVNIYLKVLLFVKII